MNPELSAYLHRSGEPPRTGCSIWLAAYGGDLPGFTAMTALAVGTDEEPYTGERNVWVRTFSVGPVVFQVFSTSVSALANQIWPSAGSVRWLSQPSLNDDGLIWIANHITATLVQSSESYHG